MKKIDVQAIPEKTGTRYPEVYAGPCKARAARAIGDAAGLTQFGVVISRVSPGAWSSQRHWHSHEDEFVYVLEGEGVLVTDDGEEVFRAGDCAGFKAGDPNGHHFQNRSDKDFVYLVVGSRNNEDTGVYPDIDMKYLARRYTDGVVYLRKNGDPF